VLVYLSSLFLQSKGSLLNLKMRLHTMILEQIETAQQQIVLIFYSSISTEKTKAIMFSRRKFSITARPRMNIWAKGEKIEQIRQHHILGLTIDTRMYWL
jgi:hypothetical protein